MPRRLASTVAALVVGGVLVGTPAPARAGGLLDTPCYATCGAYQWFLAHSQGVRENAACCIVLVKLAKRKEERALKLFEASRDPSLENWEQSDLVRRGNKMIKQRTKKLRQFSDCVNGVQSALIMQQRGFDVTADYAAACGVSLLCEDEQ